MRSLRRVLSLSLLAAAVAACSDDGGGDGPDGVEPALVPGGGVRDPGLDGVVNVYVIDADDGAPLVGATVRVGATEAVTDATGLVVGGDVSGPQTVMAKAAGHAAAVWVGVDGANVTIPLERSPADTSRPPQAQLSGSIAGWDELPPPEVNMVRVAILLYSQEHELGARANEIAQPPPNGTLPAASCVRTRGPATPCAWRMNARAGDLALGLVMLEVDNRGTGEPTDDATVVTGFSVHPLTVEDGRNQSGVMVPLPPADSGVRPTVDLGTPPAALTQVNAIAGLDLGARGVLRLGGIDPTRAGAIVPSLALSAGSSYELLAFAREPVAGDAGTPAESVMLRRGLTDAAALAAGPWLPPPTALSGTRTMLSFTAQHTGGLHVAELTNAGLGVEGRRVLTVTFLDGSSQLALPTDFVTLPADPLTLKVISLDATGGIDPRDFEIDDITARVSGAATDTLPVP